MLLATPTELCFSGRPGDPRLGEWVEIAKNFLETPSSFSTSNDRRHLVILYGCPDDTGVSSNRGRPGAKDGPNSIRKHFYKMALPMDLEWEKYIRLVDIGNIAVGNSILETHAHTKKVAEEVVKRGATIIQLGGGHDFAAPGILGWASQSKNSKGLINVDPHLDVRPLENGLPHSGTPFRQVLDSGEILGKQFTQFGSRTNRNAREHFLYCKKKGVTILTLEELRAKKVPVAALFLSQLKKIGQKAKSLAITFDMDSCREGEGTSAAPVVGFSAEELCRFAGIAGKEKKVSYFELAEVSPALDPSERTSRISAEVVFTFLYERARALKGR